jgi:inosine/xanthosine triphosphatase
MVNSFFVKHIKELPGWLFMNILVGSKNPTKIEAVRLGLAHYFPEGLVVEGYDVPSGVSKQPFHDDIFQGAMNRALAVQRLSLERRLGGEYFIGIEGGVRLEYSAWCTVGAVCIAQGEIISTAPTTGFPLPLEIVNQLLSGKELGDIIDRYTGVEDTRSKEGVVGWLTQGGVTRTEMYVPALRAAFARFLHPGLYGAKALERVARNGT